MSTPVGYSNEVWFAIKTLWESVPKISMREVLEQVGEAMKTKMPSEKVARDKKERQKWKKKIGRSPDSDGWSDTGRRAKNSDLLKITNTNDETISCDSGSDHLDQETEKNTQVENAHVYPLNPTAVIAHANKVLSSVEKVIKRHRGRTERLGDLQDKIISALEDYMAFEKPELLDEEFETKMDRRDEMLKQLFKELTLLEKLVLTSQAHQKTERESWGIESSGDDSTNELRKVDSSILDKKMANNRAALTKQKEEYVQEKMKRIESGEIFNSEKSD